jgi:hemerythrin superfamily protein
VEGLFERLESPKKGFDQALRELADQLTAHILIEEQLFYPAVRKANPDVILEGLEEHAMGRFALQRLLGTQASDESIKARLKALKELMETHHREEERELFPAVRKLTPDSELQKLGAKMQALFDASVKRGHEAVLDTFDDALRKPVRAKSVQSSAKTAQPRAKAVQSSAKTAQPRAKPAQVSPKTAPRSPKPAPRSATAQTTPPVSKQRAR